MLGQNKIKNIYYMPHILVFKYLLHTNFITLFLILFVYIVEIKRYDDFKIFELK